MSTIDAFFHNYPEIKFDLIFIDGGHSYEVAYHDILSMKKLSHKDTLLLIDDLSISGVKKAYDQCIEEGIIIPGQVFRSKHKAWSLCRYN